ncbi:MAG: hypothetical protein K9W46_06660 [Candidatus Heimdallarchaeum endolithica]|uniref:Uncharacterized protein n=1 Tax=Candidatus Heimdallarchaeum endolithica TaxID=2876572 RepID=A0A9Y1BTH5_9ARCH|nr:MAG: hypothetical protein K9W46_06660 [Candidatus Heimdallarchaeum endolithica]
MEITDPKTIDLSDNGIRINSTNEKITGNFVGTYKITSNTSVSLDMNTYYNFYDSYTAVSSFEASNSSFNSHSINWEITWSSNSIDTTYTLTSRIQSLVVRDDWNDSFNWLYNGTSSFSSSRVGNKYTCTIGTNTSAGDWKITTTSPNHIYSVSLSEDGIETDRFYLGNWSTDQTNVYGHNGSQVDFETVISGNNGSVYNETTGTLNITLFDPNGNVLPNKGNLTTIDPKYIFNDVTAYTKAGLGFSSPGLVKDNIIIDPSNGTDLPGFWTAVVFWNNGTEVGFYTKRIIVQSQTFFTAEWETEPSSGVWTNSNIARKSGDTIRINTTFYNISEPFFSGLGTPIPDARVTYTTEWGSSDNLTDYHPIYNGTISVSTGVGVYLISLVATGAFVENQTNNFTVSVFYESNIDPDYLSYTTNYTNDAIFKFDFQDVTGSTSMLPDDLIVRINGSVLNPSFYSYADNGGKVKVTINTSSASLNPGYWEVEVEAYKLNFRKSYSQQNATQLFDLTITDNPTDIIVDSADSEVYVYYNASIDFRYRDLNHSVDLYGTTYLVYSNASNVDISVSESSGVYHIDLQNNNYSVTVIGIFVNISKLGYESQEKILLVELNVKTNPTEATVETAPTDCYIGYNSSIEILYNDTVHDTGIESAVVTNVEVNATSPIDWWVEELGSRKYNITFLNTNSSVSALNITITVSKDGYVLAKTWVIINRADIPTHYEYYTSPPENITYLETETFKIFYWDDISTIKINNSQLLFSGNLTSVALTSFTVYSNGTYFITISDLTAFGKYQLVVLLTLDGYVDQSFSLSILLLKRETTLSSTTGTNLQIYAIDTLDLFLEYKDKDTDTAIEADDNQISFAQGTGNETLTLSFYFESISYNGYTVTLHSFTFDPNEDTAAGYVFVFNITLSKFGYSNNSIVIYLRVNINPSDIQCVEDSIVIDSSQQASFTIFYIDTVSNKNITGAFINVFQLNGSSSDIDSLLSYSSTPFYIVYIDPDNVNAVDKTFMFNVTLYKAGYTNQSYIIYLTVVYNPTTINTEETEITIFADQEGEFILYFVNDKTDTNIEDALVTIDIVNGSMYIEDYQATGTSPYYVYINPYDSNSSDLTFEISVTISKGGYEEQSIILYLHVKIHPTKVFTSSDTQTIYADEIAEFTVYYWDIYNVSVEEANYTVTLTFGETIDVEGITFSYNQVLGSFIFSFDFNDFTVTNETFIFNITMWKEGFENQSIILTTKIHDFIKYDLSIIIDGDTIHLLSTVTFTLILKEALLQLLANDDTKLAYSPIGENITLTLNLLDSSNNIIETSIFNITINNIQNSNYIGQFKYRIESWRAKSLEIECTYLPKQANIVSTTNFNQSFDIKFPLFHDLFYEYLSYMITAISIITVTAITLAVYFGVIRPKKQKKQAKRKQYCDTVSNILQSVTSMKKVLIVHKDTSSPVYELDLGSDMRVSSALVTGFLQAVSTMAKEITGKDKDVVKKLDYGDFIVTSAGTKNYITYIFSDKELSEDITSGLKEFVKYFERRFAHVAEN